MKSHENGVTVAYAPLIGVVFDMDVGDRPVSENDGTCGHVSKRFPCAILLFFRSDGIA